MAGYQSLDAVLASLGAMGRSRYRPARVLRFIYRHRGAHGRIIAKLKARDEKRLARLVAKKQADRLAWEKAPPSVGALKAWHERKPWKRTRTRGAT